MKKIMILSGGTSTAWHIASVLRKYYSDKMHLIICDINPEYLVHSSVLADTYIQVPPIKAENYYSDMLRYFELHQVDILIPLIDDDITLFASDNIDLQRLDIYSTAPKEKTINALSNKKNLANTLEKIDVTTPKCIKSLNDIEREKKYFKKDVIGCGSKGAEKIKGKDVLEKENWENIVVQEICTPPEITVDVIQNQGEIYIACRERIETKLGVSTKCRVFYDADIHEIIKKIASALELPTIFCVQFMKDSDNNWSLTDFNLRSGGGTAISAATGFEAVRYAAALWLEETADNAWLTLPENDSYVVRTYSEVVTQ